MVGPWADNGRKEATGGDRECGEQEMADLDERPDRLSALLHGLPALAQRHAVPGARERERCKQPAGPCTDHHHVTARRRDLGRVGRRMWYALLRGRYEAAWLRLQALGSGSGELHVHHI